MQETEYASGARESLNVTNSMPLKEPVTKEIDPLRRENKMIAASRGLPIVVSEKQFESVRMEQLTSLNLLNSSGDALLSAMNSMIPPKDSGRVIGEYTSHGIRQIAKSICDIVQTKSMVVKQMYQITRDEF